MAPAPQFEPGEPRELIIRDSEGKVTYLPLDQDQILLGRSSNCQLCYPNDSGLSRQHVALRRVNHQWQVEDLGSKNGTLLNDQKLERAMPVGIGDKIVAGHLVLELAETIPDATPTFERVEFVEENRAQTFNSETVIAKLDSLLSNEPGNLEKTSIIQGNPQMQALIRAGRELAEHRPLHELFEVIMDLSMEAVMAGRGVLMTLDGEELQTRAQRGAGFKISSTVRDRVLKEKASLLVRDAMMDQALREQKSIVQQRVRGMIAVPLQTNDRVIGLIYVDTPDMIREFSKEDLGLLTVMANVAAIRIEHARLLEIELTERAMAKELAQAAHIQMGLLPSRPPKVDGLEIAGSTAPCRTVGGDYYDYLEFPDGRIAILVGDVAGKGMPASLLMSSLQARVKVLFEDGDRLAEKITRLNKTTAASTPDNRFITFFMTVADPATGELVFTNAGHNPPLLVRKSGGFDQLEGGGMILGIIPFAQYTEARAQMDRGDVLVLFSDGVTEAVNRADEDFGEKRLAELVASLADRPAIEIAHAVHAAVASYTEGAPPADDITVVVAKRM